MDQQPYADEHEGHEAKKQREKNEAIYLCVQANGLTLVQTPPPLN